MIPIDPIPLPYLGVPDTNQAAMEDEWEYEYEQDEVDTFYLTLDLTSSTTSRHRGNKRKHHETSQGIGSIAVQDLSRAEGLEALSSGENNLRPRSVYQSSSERLEHNKVQVLDLHSSNPVISYQGQVFSCRWESSIGTELFFTKPLAERDYPALRSNPEYSLLAASSLRIASQPAQLVPKKITRAANIGELPLTAAQNEQDLEGRIPVGLGGQPGRLKQVRFLENLMDVKAQKGEQDEVTVYAIKRQTGTGWRAQERLRREGREAEEQRRQANDDLGCRESVPTRKESAAPQGIEPTDITQQNAGRSTNQSNGRPRRPDLYTAESSFQAEGDGGSVSQRSNEMEPEVVEPVARLESTESQSLNG